METFNFTLHKYIPDLNPLYNALREFIKEHQGEKGYIDTQECGLDTIYGFMFDEGNESYTEMLVYGVRVNSNDEIDIVLRPLSAAYIETYDEECFKHADWFSLRLSDVMYVQTLFNIAEFIEEYIEKE